MSESRGRVLTVVLVAFVGLSTVVVPSAGHVPHAPPSDQSAGSSPLDGEPFAQSEIDPDAVVLRADVGVDGDATWTVELRVRLDDENATAAFESVQADVEENATAVAADFATGMERTVRNAENATDREMAMENLTVTATKESISQEYGVLTYQFTWQNFAAVDSDRLRIGDAVSGLFLDSESSLVLAWPADYGTEQVTPAADDRGNRSVTWHGRTALGPDEPRVVVAPTSGTETGPGSGSGTETADEESTPTALLVAGGLVLVALLAAGWVVAGRARGGREEPAHGTERAGARASDSQAPDAAAADADSPGAAPDSGLAEAGADSGVGARAAGESGESDEPPEELLSNEERVIKLLEANGGRIKQQRIASEYDWTDAKTSQVVGNLRDQGKVETFRIGRENVVTLPEESDL